MANGASPTWPQPGQDLIPPDCLQRLRPDHRPLKTLVRHHVSAIHDVNVAENGQVPSSSACRAFVAIFVRLIGCAGHADARHFRDRPDSPSAPSLKQSLEQAPSRRSRSRGPCSAGRRRPCESSLTSRRQARLGLLSRQSDSSSNTAAKGKTTDRLTKSSARPPQLTCRSPGQILNPTTDHLRPDRYGASSCLVSARLAVSPRSVSVTLPRAGASGVCRIFPSFECRGASTEAAIINRSARLAGSV